MKGQYKPLLKASHAAVKPVTPVKEAGGLIAAIQVGVRFYSNGEAPNCYYLQ